MAAGHMRIACWITKETHTHSHTHRICNTYCFSTVAMVTQSRFNVTSYVLCLIVLLLLFIKLVMCLTMARVWTLNLNKFRNKIPWTPKAMQNCTATPATKRTASRLEQDSAEQSRALVLLLGCRPAKPCGIWFLTPFAIMNIFQFGFAGICVFDVSTSYISLVQGASQRKRDVIASSPHRKSSFATMVTAE